MKMSEDVKTNSESVSVSVFHSLTRFSGDAKTVSVTKWAKDIERSAVTYGWSARLQLLIARKKLEGRAALWLKGEDEHKTYEELKTALQDWFPADPDQEECSGSSDSTSTTVTMVTENESFGSFRQPPEMFVSRTEKTQDEEVSAPDCCTHNQRGGMQFEEKEDLTDWTLNETLTDDNLRLKIVNIQIENYENLKKTEVKEENPVRLIHDPTTHCTAIMISSTVVNMIAVRDNQDAAVHEDKVQQAQDGNVSVKTERQKDGVFYERMPIKGIDVIGSLRSYLLMDKNFPFDRGRTLI